MRVQRSPYFVILYSVKYLWGSESSKEAVRPLNIVYIQPFCLKKVWLVPNEKTYLCKQEERICVILLWSNKVAVEEGQYCCCGRFGYPKSWVYFFFSCECFICLFPFLSIKFRLLCSKWLTSFLEWIKENINDYLTQDCPETLKS